MTGAACHAASSSFPSSTGACVVRAALLTRAGERSTGTLLLPAVRVVDTVVAPCACAGMACAHRRAVTAKASEANEAARGSTARERARRCVIDEGAGSAWTGGSGDSDFRHPHT